MRNIGREPGYAIEGIFQPIQHLVEGASQRCQLKGITFGEDSLPEMSGADAPGSRCHLFHRPNALARDLITNQRENRQSPQYDHPKHQSKVRQESFFLRDINGNLNRKGMTLESSPPALLRW